MTNNQGEWEWRIVDLLRGKAGPEKLDSGWLLKVMREAGVRNQWLMGTWKEAHGSHKFFVRVEDGAITIKGFPPIQLDKLRKK
jgi:hypothetical protein